MSQDYTDSQDNALGQDVQENNRADEVQDDGVSPVELLKNNPTTIEDIQALRSAVFNSLEKWERFEIYVREELTEDDADYQLRYAMGMAVLGHYKIAEPLLQAMQETPVIACLLGRIYLETGRPHKAVEIFGEIHKRVPEVHDYLLFLIEAYEAAEDLTSFNRELEKLETSHPDEPPTLYFKGLSAEREGEYGEAKAYYNKALELNETHAPSIFRLAYRLDLEGEDEEAMTLYRRCIDTGTPNLAALVNLGLLYEDDEQYDEACACFDLANLIFPHDNRLRIYKRDAEACKTMYYDEEKEKKEDKQAQIMRIPVTDFELSVRSRNCLSKMNIRTLGDLIKKTEAELLAFKNFGETSLQEIKSILNSKGLRLGYVLPEAEEIPNFLEPIEETDQQESIMGKPLDELDLSVRSRNCLTMLQIKTLGQLANTSEQQLVSCKNFGQTSLNEIRKKLGDYGLALKS